MSLNEVSREQGGGRDDRVTRGLPLVGYQNFWDARHDGLIFSYIYSIKSTFLSDIIKQLPEAIF